MDSINRVSVYQLPDGTWYAARWSDSDYKCGKLDVETGADEATAVRAAQAEWPAAEVARTDGFDS